MPDSNKYFVYFLTNWNNKVLYIGITNHLQRRIDEHKNKRLKGFTDKLVYFEETGCINAAREREKQLKKWRREKKNTLVASANPQWRDLSSELMV